jgi:hypothetical protein
MGTETDIGIEERLAQALERARQNPNFGKVCPPIGSPRRHKDTKLVKYHNSKPHPACPEPSLPRHSVIGPDLSHREHVRQFDADAGGRDEVVLEDLKRGFDLEHPRVPGQWFTGFYFFKVHRIKAANSCACRLRKHPFIVRNGLDIDSGQVPAAERNANLERNEWWQYRVCHRMDSERLKREALARERKELERQEKEPALVR